MTYEPAESFVIEPQSKMLFACNHVAQCTTDSLNFLCVLDSEAGVLTQCLLPSAHWPVPGLAALFPRPPMIRSDYLADCCQVAVVDT